MIDDLNKLRESLIDMPVPEPKAGFEDRVLTIAIATAARAGAAAHVRSTFRRHSSWWAAGLGALAATVACLAVFWTHPAAAPGANVMLALHESRDVSLVIDSERDLAGATIRLYVTGSVALTGYEDQHEIEWKTSLTQGANLLSLPVVGRTPGDGSLVAEIEHDGRTRRMSVTLHVTAPGDDTA